MLELMRAGSGVAVFAFATLLGCGGKSLETQGGAAAGAGSVVSSAGTSGSGGAEVSSAGAGGSGGSTRFGSAGAAGQAACPTVEPDEGSACTSLGLACPGFGAEECPETALCGALGIWNTYCPIYPVGPYVRTCSCPFLFGTVLASSGAPLQHHATSELCPSERAPITTLPVPLCNGNDAYCPNYCVQDSDCTEGPNGRCSSFEGGAYACSYDDCFSDEDCQNGAYCECRAARSSDSNNCVGSRGNCHSDIDCGLGGYCSPSNAAEWCGPDYYCHTPGDTCLNDSDCEGPDGCNFDAALAHWVCGAGCGPAPSPP